MYYTNMDERLLWLGFSVFPGIGPKKFHLLLQHFETAKHAWHATENDLEKVIGISLTVKFVSFRSTFSPNVYEKKLREKGVRFVTLQDETYPALLAQSSNAPTVLYIKGAFSFPASDMQRSIAIVGTRKITQYGKEVTTRITEDLIRAGYVIVSGLALGVDAVAHGVTVAEQGKTIAVLGCGVDCCYPSANTSLYDQIIATGGAIVSEFPLSMTPSVGSFPSRNRIIAGLSQAVVVTEGAADSGALYTAKDAFANNRKVYAVPGPITSTLSHGPHSLIAQGGKLIMGAQDILSDLGGSLSSKPRIIIHGDTPEEQQILDLIANEQLHIDELTRLTKKDAAAIGSLLSLMEMKGMIQNNDGGFIGIVSS